MTALASGWSTLGVTAFAWGMRMAWGLAVRAPYVWDAELYERGARALARGMGFSCFLFGPQADGRVPTAYYPVGYPAWLAGFYKVLGEAPWVVVFAGALAGAVSVALVHRMALRLTDARSALAAAIGLAVLPGGVMFASVPMTETLWAALLLAAMFSLVRRDGAPNPRDLVLAGALLAAATYVRPQALVLTGVLPAMRGGSWRVRVHRVAVVAGVAFALVAPWTLRNCRVLDGCVLVSANGGSNLAIGAVPRADGGYLTLTPDDGCRGVRGEVARDRCWRRVAWAHIRRDPLRWLALCVTKLEKTFHRETFPVDYLAVARPDLVTPVRRAWGHALLSLTWQATLVLGVTGALRRGRTMGPVGHLTAATLAVLTATHGVFFGGDRYHLPMVPLLVLLASGGWGRGVRGPFTQGERAREGAPGVSSVG